MSRDASSSSSTVASASPSAAPGFKPRSPTAAADTPPSFLNLKQWLVGQWVDIYSPPGHLLTVAYADRADGPDGPGRFSGKLLDVTVDAGTGEVLFGLLQYAEKNARRYYQRDVLPLKGCAISVTLERDDEPDDAPDTTKK